MDNDHNCLFFFKKKITFNMIHVFSGFFPEILKLFIIVPIYKGGDKKIVLSH